MVGLVVVSMMLVVLLLLHVSLVSVESLRGLVVVVGLPCGVLCCYSSWWSTMTCDDLGMQAVGCGKDQM